MDQRRIHISKIKTFDTWRHLQIRFCDANSIWYNHLGLWYYCRNHFFYHKNREINYYCVFPRCISSISIRILNVLRFLYIWEDIFVKLRNRTFVLHENRVHGSPLISVALSIFIVMRQFIRSFYSNSNSLKPATLEESPGRLFQNFYTSIAVSNIYKKSYLKNIVTSQKHRSVTFEMLILFTIASCTK